MLLDVASDDLVEADQIRRLIRDLREVRLAKMRIQVEGLDATAVGGGDGLPLTGVGAMEIGESRGFMSGVAETFRYVSILCPWENFNCEQVFRALFLFYKSDTSFSTNSVCFSLFVGKSGHRRKKLRENGKPKKLPIRSTMKRMMITMTWNYKEMRVSQIQQFSSCESMYYAKGQKGLIKFYARLS